MQVRINRPREVENLEPPRPLSSVEIDVLIEDLRRMQIGEALTRSWCSGVSLRLQDGATQSDWDTREMVERMLSACWEMGIHSRSMSARMRILRLTLQDWQLTMRRKERTKGTNEPEQLRLPGF